MTGTTPALSGRRQREMVKNFKASQDFRVQSFIFASTLVICKSMWCAVGVRNYSGMAVREKTKLA